MKKQTGRQEKKGLRIIDREIRYVSGPRGQNLVPRSLPVTEHAMMPSVPPLPATIPSPYPWGGKENVFFSWRRALTDNIYHEPGKTWVLELGVITRGIADTVEGAKTYKIWYRTSRDGGRTFGHLKPVIKRGKEYDLLHPIDGVRVEKNSFNVDVTRPIVRGSNGEIMVPVDCKPLDKKRNPYNPLKTYGYLDAGVLIGRWEKAGRDIVWDFGRWIRLSPEKSTRGICEPTIVELKRKGEFMLVGRGSNCRHIFTSDGKHLGLRKTPPVTPGYKWVSYSRDYCRTWSEPVPFTYSDGTRFFSPASCSTLIRSRYNNRLYWLGNISLKSTAGNNPRYPLVMGEVDEKNPGLKRESILVLDTRNPVYDSTKMELSNFGVYEDPDTGNITVVLNRIDPAAVSGRNTDHGNTWYLIGVPKK